MSKATSPNADGVNLPDLQAVHRHSRMEKGVRMSTPGKLRTRATVLCFRSGRLLLVRRKSRGWNFPGGSVKPHECPLSAAVRELQEETGIRRQRLVQLCTIRAGRIVHHIFTLQIDERDRPVPQNEIVACKWVQRRKLGPSRLGPAAAELLARKLPALVA
ncbi:NUDIX domain-containing protein [Pseudomonas putida]|uniref:NUDIX domain-containing protein n=1 Tax=Pseudomonas putida TaxID=303 RepID=UPI00226D47DE|nr:NUDIX domain-containing protein [Pseudomonas putida]WAC00500.1 NUDIX domain-containing protein [Pseudomonas putida]